MIEKIIEYSIKNKFLVILMTLFVVAAGIYAMLKTPLDAIPDLSAKLEFHRCRNKKAVLF